MIKDLTIKWVGVVLSDADLEVMISFDAENKNVACSQD